MPASVICSGAWRERVAMMKTAQKYTGVGIGLGIALGTAIGAATDHVGLGVAFGLIFGLVIGAAKARRNSSPPDSN